MVDVLPIDIREELFNISEELKTGYYLKEAFLDIVKHATYADAEEQIKAWISLCYESEIEEYIIASGTIERWLPYIVESFINPILSQGFTEGRNNKFKVIKRIAFGYKNFKFYRLRILYICNGKISGGSSKTTKKKK